MKSSRFTETQIVSILKEADAGAKVKVEDKSVCTRPQWLHWRTAKSAPDM